MGRAHQLSFSPLDRSHLPVLQRWLGEPHVARWWNHDTSDAAVEKDFGPVIDGVEPGEDFVVELDGRPVGLIQLSRFSDHPDYAAELAPVLAVGEGDGTIDYLIGEPSLVGRGLGARLIDIFVDHVWASAPDLDALVVAVHEDNEASWRGLQRAGFTLVGHSLMAPDNPVDDERHVVLRRDRVAAAPSQQPAVRS
jgi:aminoglycoside 6'-N-acetyltransferase